MYWALLIMVVLGLLAWVFRRERMDRQGLLSHARARGWGVEEDGGHLRLFPADRRWLIEVVATPLSTTWIATAPVLDGLLAVRAGPPLPGGVTHLGNSFVQTLLRRALIEMCGEDPGQATPIHMVAVGEPVFDATHTVITTAPELARLLTPEVQSLLRAWPAGLVVPDFVYWRRGLRLGIVGKVNRLPESLDALVQTGEGLAAIKPLAVTSPKLP